MKQISIDTDGIRELTMNELEEVHGGIAPFLLACFGYGFAVGVTSAIAAYAATHYK